MHANYHLKTVFSHCHWRSKIPTKIVLIIIVDSDQKILYIKFETDRITFNGSPERVHSKNAIFREQNLRFY